MDVSNYKGTAYLKVKDVEDGPIRVKIARVEEGSFDKLDCYFNDGSVLSLNKTNVGTLAREFGDESDEWLDQEVELYLGTIEYKGTTNKAVLVRVVVDEDDEDELAEKPTAKPAAKVAARGDMDDEIPF